MRRSKFILLALALIVTGNFIGCASMTAESQQATARILGRRIGQHGTQLYPKLFIGLGITAGEACQQSPHGEWSTDIAFSQIAKAIEQKTEDPFLAYDLKDVIQIMGIDLDQAYKVINLTPKIQRVLLQFICSFAQGVKRAKGEL